MGKMRRIATRRLAAAALVASVAASPRYARNRKQPGLRVANPNGNGLGAHKEIKVQGPVVQRLSRLPRGRDARSARHSTRPTAARWLRVPLHRADDLRAAPEHSSQRRRRPDRWLAVPVRPFPRRAERRVARGDGSRRLERGQPRVRRGHHRAAPHAVRRLPPGRRLLLPRPPYDGADFPWLAANVVKKDRRARCCPPTWIKTIDGMKIGFIGMTLEGTPTLVDPPGSRASRSTTRSSRPTRRPPSSENNVQAIVVLLHEGGAQTRHLQPVRRHLRPDRRHRDHLDPASTR